MIVDPASLNTYPVRNVPSILYTNPPVHSLQPTNHAIFSPDVNIRFSAETKSRTKLAAEDYESISSLPTKVSFVPVNDNEYIAMATGITATNNKSRFDIQNIQILDNVEKSHTLNIQNILNSHSRLPKKHVKDADDYIFQLYVGSLSVIGLFMFFRLIQKS